VSVQVEKILALGDTDPSAADSKGMTALHLAAQSDHKQIVKVRVCICSVRLSAPRLDTVFAAFRM